METLALNDTLDQRYFADIYRTFHPKAKEYTLFSRIRRTFSKMEYTFGDKQISNLRKLKLYQAFFFQIKIYEARCELLK